MNNKEYVLIKLAQWKEGKNPNVKPPNNYRRITLQQCL